MSTSQPVWWCARDGEKSGPYTAAQLKIMAQTGDVCPHHRVWREGRDRWVQASAVRGLFPPQSPPASEPGFRVPLMDLHTQPAPLQLAEMTPADLSAEDLPRPDPGLTARPSVVPPDRARAQDMSARAERLRHLRHLPDFEPSGPPTEPATAPAPLQEAGGLPPRRSRAMGGWFWVQPFGLVSLALGMCWLLLMN